MNRFLLCAFVFLLFACKAGNENSSKSAADNHADSVNSANVAALSITDDCVPKGYSEFEILTSRRFIEDYPDNFLLFMPKKDLRLLRNSIYAAKGYQFKSEDLFDYFTEKSWYCPKYENVDSLLTPEEIANINYIKLWEDKVYPDSINEYDYFIGLFKNSSEIIPLYFQKYYLGLISYEKCCRTGDLLKQTNRFFTLIYHIDLCFPPSWSEPETSIVTINAKGEIINSQSIYPYYTIIGEDTIETYNIKWNEIDEDNYEYEADTLGTYQYLIDNEGYIIEIPVF